MEFFRGYNLISLTLPLTHGNIFRRVQSEHVFHLHVPRWHYCFLHLKNMFKDYQTQSKQVIFPEQSEILRTHAFQTMESNQIQKRLRNSWFYLVQPNQMKSGRFIGYKVLSNTLRRSQNLQISWSHLNKWYWLLGSYMRYVNFNNL